MTEPEPPPVTVHPDGSISIAVGPVPNVLTVNSAWQLAGQILVRTQPVGQPSAARPAGVVVAIVEHPHASIILLSSVRATPLLPAEAFRLASTLILAAGYIADPMEIASKGVEEPAVLEIGDQHEPRSILTRR